MPRIEQDVWGQDINLDAVDPRVRAVAIAVAFGSSSPDMFGWWNHIKTANEVIRIIDFWED